MQQDWLQLVPPAIKDQFGITNNTETEPLEENNQDKMSNIIDFETAEPKPVFILQVQ